MIHPAEEFQAAVGQVTCPIPSPVDACSWGGTEWIGNKLFCGQIGAIQITTNQILSSTVNLPWHTDGCELESGAQDINLPCGMASSDVDHRIVLSALAFSVSRTRGLCSAIDNAEFCRQFLKKTFFQLNGENLAKTDDLAQRVALLQIRFFENNPEHRRNKIEDSDLLLCHEFDQCSTVLVHPRRSNDDPGPCEQWSKNL